ncbi:MAG TPA: ribulose-phosphate 3-epimerase, partial [Solirubrobacterales bacterium]|nr:ribulose-phosphate 3-epimerase [Solirubrobacterales bacterium]
MSERMRELLEAPRVAPSILSADFSRLGAQVAEVMDAGARVIHVDIMDGHFVPPITIGPAVAKSIADQVHEAGGALDVHLMIAEPDRHIEAF